MGAGYGGVGYGKRGGGSSIAPGTDLLPYQNGIFQRVQTNPDGGATTVRTAADQVTFMGQDVWRREDLSDGFGPITLIERAREDIMGRSQEFDVAPWSVLLGATVNANSTTSPDTRNNADRVNFAANANSAIQQTLATGLVPDNTVVTWQVWAKSDTPQVFRFTYVNRAGVTTNSADMATTSTWQRYTITFNTGVGGSTVIVRLKNGSDGAARSVYFWGASMEQCAYVRSGMKNLIGTQVDFGEDSLTFFPGLFPNDMLTKKWRIDLWPDWAAANLIAADDYGIFSFGGPNDYVRCFHDGANVVAQVLSGGVVVATSPVWANAAFAHQTLLVDPVVGQLTLNGVPGAVGTPWTFPAGVQGRLGGILGSAGNEFDGRLGPILKV